MRKLDDDGCYPSDFNTPNNQEPPTKRHSRLRVIPAQSGTQLALPRVIPAQAGTQFALPRVIPAQAGT